MALSRCVAFSLIAVFLAGCIVIPTNFYSQGSRKNVREQMPEIVSGKTTLEEVFLMLGEPDTISSDERRAAYEWTKVKALWAVGGANTAITGSIEKETLFVIEFDSLGVVSGTKVESKYKGAKF